MAAVSRTSEATVRIQYQNSWSDKETPASSPTQFAFVNEAEARSIMESLQNVLGVPALTADSIDALTDHAPYAVLTRSQITEIANWVDPQYDELLNRAIALANRLVGSYARQSSTELELQDIWQRWNALKNRQ